WVSVGPSGLWQAPLSGQGEAATVIVGPGRKETAAYVFGVAVDGTHLYWSDSAKGAIKRRALADLEADLVGELVTGGETHPQKIALAGDRVFWVTEGGLV